AFPALLVFLLQLLAPLGKLAVAKLHLTLKLLLQLLEVFLLLEELLLGLLQLIDPLIIMLELPLELGRPFLELDARLAVVVALAVLAGSVAQDLDKLLAKTQGGLHEPGAAALE